MFTNTSIPDRLGLTIYYLDESGHHTLAPMNTQNFAIVAIGIPAERWNEAFDRIRDYRRGLLADFGVPLHKEIHATKLISGRGRPNPKSFVSNDARVEIYERGLLSVAALEDLGVHVIGVKCQNRPGVDVYDVALQSMLDRIQRTMARFNRQALLVFDSGREKAIRRKMRKARVFNPVGSRGGGAWNSGESYRNIPTDRILGDPFFRESGQDYFIQLADSASYALLKYFEPPNARDTKYKLFEAYDKLDAVTYKPAATGQKHGIVQR